MSFRSLISILTQREMKHRDTKQSVVGSLRQGWRDKSKIAKSEKYQGKNFPWSLWWENNPHPLGHHTHILQNGKKESISVVLSQEV